MAKKRKKLTKSPARAQKPSLQEQAARLTQRQLVRPIDPQQELLRVPQAALLMGISEMSCYRRIADGSIPSVRIGPTRGLRVPRGELMHRIQNDALYRVAK